MPEHAPVLGNYDPEIPYRAMVVNVTNHCNLDCRHCFVFREGNPSVAPASIRDEMSDERMLATLAALRDRHGIGMVLWMGGEPLLKPKLLRRAVKLCPRNTITTNGTVPLIDFGPDLLYVISLDGPRDLNDAIRGEGVFDRVMDNLSRLPADFASPVQVQSVVTRSNEARLEELVCALQETRVGWMTFSFLVPASGDADNPDAWHDNEARAGAVRRVMALKARYPGFIRNTSRHLELLLSPYAERVTAHCPPRRTILSLYLEGDHFRVPFCCHGDDVDCARCGAWVVFHTAAMMERSGVISWESEATLPLHRGAE